VAGSIIRGGFYSYLFKVCDKFFNDKIGAFNSSQNLSIGFPTILVFLIMLLRSTKHFLLILKVGCMSRRRRLKRRNRYVGYKLPTLSVVLKNNGQY